MKRLAVWGFLVLSWLAPFDMVIGAEVGEPENFEAFEDSISLQEVERAFQDLQGEGANSPAGKNFSLTDYVRGVAAGEQDFSLSGFLEQGAEFLAGQFEEQKGALFKILALGILAGIFINFSDTVGEKSLGETGFYITYILLFAVAAAGFYTAFCVARDSLADLLAFMRALVPSFSLALCLSGGTGTSAAYYETMLIALTFMETFMAYVFLPGVQVYFMLGMMNPLAEHHFTRAAELVKSVLRGSVKVLFGVLLGYQGIQGLLLPVMDKVGKSAVLNTAKGIPGVGNTVGGVADTVYGSSLLIKSAVGTGGLICILILCCYPILKLLLFTFVYRLGGALVQPVSDGRMASALGTTAESGKLLMGVLLAGALMFLLSITIVLAGSNFL